MEEREGVRKGRERGTGGWVGRMKEREEGSRRRERGGKKVKKWGM